MINKVFIRLLLAAAVIAPTGASAQAQIAAASEPASSVEASPFGAAMPIEDVQLNTITGQADLAQVVNAQNKGVVSGNTITGESHTGTINFDSSSFQNLNGLSLLSANTGNNVSINSSLNVNVSITNR